MALGVPVGATVEQVRPEVTYPLRRQVLRPGRPADEALFRGDHRTSTGHFAAYVNDRVVGVASVLAEAEDALAFGDAGPGVWRLRGMAVDPPHRGAGVGTALLLRVRDFVARSDAGLIWCNARVSALGFYESAGFVTAGEPWNEPGIGPHIRMRDEVELIIAVVNPEPGADLDGQFEATLRAMRRLQEQVCPDAVHPWLDLLLDSDHRRDPATLNYLVSGAAGSLRDRYFSALNRDRVPSGGQGAINREWARLIEQATELARQLGLPAGGRR